MEKYVPNHQPAVEKRYDRHRNIMTEKTYDGDKFGEGIFEPEINNDMKYEAFWRRK